MLFFALLVGGIRRRAKTAILLAALTIGGCAKDVERRPLSLYVLYPAAGRDDYGFTDMVHNAVIFGRWQFTLEDHEIEVCPEAADCGEAARQVLTPILDAPPAEPRLLVTMGELYPPVLNERQCAFNGTAVLHLDGRTSSCKALRSVVYRTFGPAFLAGVAAMERIRADNDAGRFPAPQPLGAGIIGREEVSSMEYIEGFIAGTRYAGGDVTVEDTAYLQGGPGNQADQARAATRILLGNGVRVILAAAGDIGPEVSAEVWSFYRSDENQVIDDDAEPAPAYVIGVDSDQSMINSRVTLGSIVKHVDYTVREAMYEAADGELAFGATTVGFDDGATELIYNPTFYDEGIHDAIEAARPAAREAAAVYEAP